MGEQNPLQDAEVKTIDNSNKNVKGRPCREKCLKFSPQPKSIVSQMLTKMRSENQITLPIEKEKKVIADNPSSLISVVNEIEDYDNSLISCRNKTKAKIKECKEPIFCKIYSCDYSSCTYTSKLSSNITKHKRIHTTEKPYLCDRCSFRTNFVNSLKVHRRLHTEERPYQCQHCNYKCNSISNLKKHCHTRHKNFPNGNIT